MDSNDEKLNHIKTNFYFDNLKSVYFLAKIFENMKKSTVFYLFIHPTSK